MGRLGNFLQSFNLYIDPRILLYVFLGLAVLSLISLCSVLFSNENKIEKDLDKNIEKVFDEDLKDIPTNKVEVKPEVVAVTNKSLEQINEPIINNEFKPNEEIIEANNITELPNIEPLEEPVLVAQPEPSNIPVPPAVYLEPATKEPEINPVETETIPVVPEPNFDEIPPIPKPQIFSSVYLERKDVNKPEVEEVEHSEIIEIPMPAKNIVSEPEVKEELYNFEEDINEVKGPEIYPDIVNEIQAHRREETNNLNFSLSRAMPGKVIPNEEQVKSQAPEPEVKEVVLTPDILKARLAKLNEALINDIEKPTAKEVQGNAELDSILKQIGMENSTSPAKLADEEKAILGR